MKLSEFKSSLSEVTQLKLMLPNGTPIPAHFHVTELALISKNFIDCGGVARVERKVTFQLWVANDFDHRLTSFKWLGIIKKGELDYGLTDEPVEIEYQGQTIERYGISFSEGVFHLTPLYTECLAPDHCGIPAEQVPKTSCCSPSTGCC
ncbi:MAG: hypothetical protein RIQ90_208 [Bacteroidota bacterium]|jgi:hypothetical protein